MPLVTEKKNLKEPVNYPPEKRRRHPRYAFSATAEAVEATSDARVNGRTSDLGLGSCYIDTISPFPVGTDAKVRITRGQSIFEAQARVVYSQVGLGMGLTFVSAQNKHAALFQKWIRELGGQAPTELEAQQLVSPESARSGLNEEHYVLNELVIALMRKSILSESEGESMLSRLHHSSEGPDTSRHNGSR